MADELVMSHSHTCFSEWSTFSRCDAMRCLSFHSIRTVKPRAQYSSLQIRIQIRSASSALGCSPLFSSPLRSARLRSASVPRDSSAEDSRRGSALLCTEQRDSLGSPPLFSFSSFPSHRSSSYRLLERSETERRRQRRRRRRTPSAQVESSA